MKYFIIILILLVVSSKTHAQVATHPYYKLVSEYFKIPDNVISPFLGGQDNKGKRRWISYYHKNFVKDSILQFSISPIIIGNCKLYYPNLFDSTYSKFFNNILQTTQCDSIFILDEKVQLLETNPLSEFVAFFSHPRGQSLVVDMFHSKDPNCKFSYSTFLSNFVRYLFFFDAKDNIIRVETIHLIQ